MLAQRGTAGAAVFLFLAGEKPEQQRGDEQDGAEHLRHQVPGAECDQGRSEELGHRRPRVASAEDAHGKTLVLLIEPFGDVGNAHRERTTGQADEQPQHQELPEGRGEGDQVQRQYAGEHQQEEHDPSAKAVGQKAQGQTHQRAGQYRRGGQQAELGFVEGQQFLDRNAQHGKHHPDHEAHGEGQGTHPEYQPLLHLCSHHEALRQFDERSLVIRTLRKLDLGQRAPGRYRPMLGPSTSKEVGLDIDETLCFSIS